MTKHGYENVSIGDIRVELEKDFGVTDKETLAQTKKPLVEFLLQLKAESHEDDESLLMDDDIFGNTEADVLNSMVSTETVSDDIPLVQPPFNNPNWHEWVISQFEEDELEGGCPTCDGLRRVTENTIGPISKVEIIKNDAPNMDNKGNATVVVGITIDPVILDSHPMAQRSIYVEDVADANQLNTPPEIFKHPSATAGTRAESRAYRKILRLRKVLTAEEANSEAADSDDNWTPSEPITDQQINVIDLLCHRNNVNLMEFLNCGDKTYVCIEQVTKYTAQRMLQHLNKIQRKNATCPEGVGEYDENWRVKNDENKDTP